MVFYGGVGVGSDVDEIVKPQADGFSEDALLRSAASPGRLFYRVGLPEGASLVEAGSGSVEVVEGGSVVASLTVPRVEDAAGVSGACDDECAGGSARVVCGKGSRAI